MEAYNLKEMEFTCLDNILGLTRSNCDCTIDSLKDDELPDDWYKQSTSNLFLDELEGIVPIKAVGKAGACEGEMANFYFNALQTARQTTIDELMVAITQRGINGQKTYTGKIAGTSFSSIQNLNAIGYAGLRLSTRAMKGGKITIKSIYAMMNADATFDIQVYKLDKDATELEQLATITNIQSLANVLKETALVDEDNKPDPYVISLSEYGADFYLVYQPTTFLPLRNTISCGCGRKESDLKRYLTVSGAIAPTLNDPFTNYSNGMGISLNASVGCDTSTLICEAFNNDDGINKVLPYTIRFKAGELVQEYVAKTNNISRYTMVDKEYIWGKRNHFKAEYNTRITWMAQNINLDLIDCYICNDKRIRKGGILV